MENKPKFQPLSFLLAALVVLGVGATAFLILPNVGLPGSSASAPPIATATDVSVPSGWLIYRDPQAGFSFRYPPDAHVEFGNNELHPYAFIRVVFAQPEQGSLIVDVRANNAKQLPEAFAAQAYAETTGATPPPDLISPKEIVTVGSKQASRFVIPPTQTDFILYLPINDKMLVIYPGSAGQAVVGQPQVREIFNQVLGTFQFNDN